MITKKSLQNLNGLLMLSAIAKYQSKRKVAEVTNSSIDTVNKYISNLEQDLGVQLVINNAKGTYLTSRAVSIVEQVENVQELLDKIYREHHTQDKCEGNVCICLPLMVSTALSPYCVSCFSETYPRIKVISLTTLGSPNYEEMGIDFGIVTAQPVSSKDFSLLYKKNIECCFFAVPDYLAKYGYPKDTNDLLKNHRIINGLQNTNYIPGWKNLIARAQNISFSTNSTFAVVEAIRHGLGVGLMPRQFQSGNLVCLDKLNDHFQMTVYLVVNNCTKDIPRVKIVTEYYKAAIDRI